MDLKQLQSTNTDDFTLKLHVTMTGAQALRMVLKQLQSINTDDFMLKLHVTMTEVLD